MPTTINEAEEIKELSDPDLKVGDKVMIKKASHSQPYKATVVNIDRKLGLLEYHIEGYGFVEDGFITLPKSKFMSSLKNALDSTDNINESVKNNLKESESVIKLALKSLNYLKRKMGLEYSEHESLQPKEGWETYMITGPNHYLSTYDTIVKELDKAIGRKNFKLQNLGMYGFLLYLKNDTINESVKVGPIYRLGTEDFITSYNDIRLDEIGITLEDIELFKRVDTSESAPDKVNYLLYISMRWDGDNTISVPISYNISDNEYEQEINPPMLGIYDEDLDSEVYDTVDEVVRNLALKISQSGRMNEFDSFNATPEEIDDYYSNEYYNKTQEETDPEKKFKNACYTAASQWMSGVTEETSKEFIEDMILPIAKRAYSNPNYSDEDYLNEIIFNLENERGIRFNFNKK